MIHHFDNHCLGMRGIKHACSRTRDASPGAPVTIYYDSRYGVVGTYIADTRYRPSIDGKVVFVVCTTTGPMTMQKIADRILETWTAQRAEFTHPTVESEEKP